MIDDYVELRIRDIPSKIHQTFPNVKQIWKCDNQVDFLYGYYVGKIEEDTALSSKDNKNIPGGFVDVFEIRGIIETHRTDLKNSIKKALSEVEILL